MLNGIVLPTQASTITNINTTNIISEYKISDYNHLTSYFLNI